VAWRSYGPFHPVIAYFIYSAARAFTPCIILGMPATAVALWLRLGRSALQAAAAVSGIPPTLFFVAAESSGSRSNFAPACNGAADGADCARLPS
jgi:hypothetical protein